MPPCHDVFRRFFQQRPPCQTLCVQQLFCLPHGNLLAASRQLRPGFPVPKRDKQFRVRIFLCGPTGAANENVWPREPEHEVLPHV